jgi:hypothetical protein
MSAPFAFDAGSFGDVFNADLGQELWDFLNENDNVIRMQTAAYLKRPSVEPLSPWLLQRFGDAVRQDRIKQTIGRMVRQILEHHGYRIDQQNVKITQNKNMFTSGTRYQEAA